MYTPPDGDAVHFNFTASYTPPDGDEAFFDFSEAAVTTTAAVIYIMT